MEVVVQYDGWSNRLSQSSRESFTAVATEIPNLIKMIVGCAEMNPGRCKCRHRWGIDGNGDEEGEAVLGFRQYELNLFNTVLVQNMLLVTSILNF